jgi:DNA-binding NarL/FixJ family response regulator
VDAVRPILVHLGAEEIVVAYNGSDGVAAARQTELDLALVDLGLPDRSGLSVGREIMDLNPRMLVVALTAVSDAMIARHALKLGFAAYLPKEISVNIFTQGLRNVLRGQRLDLSSAGAPDPSPPLPPAASMALAVPHVRPEDIPKHVGPVVPRKGPATRLDNRLPREAASPFRSISRNPKTTARAARYHESQSPGFARKAPETTERTRGN